jgi:hypothetical protein
MTCEESILIIRQYQDQWGIPDLLQALEEMQLCYEELNYQEAVAFRTFMAMGYEMFKPKESA